MFNLASVGCLTLPLRRLSIAPHSQEESVFREGKTYLGMPSSSRRRRRESVAVAKIGASPCPTRWLSKGEVPRVAFTVLCLVSFPARLQSTFVCYTFTTFQITGPNAERTVVSMLRQRPLGETWT